MITLLKNRHFCFDLFYILVAGTTTSAVLIKAAGMDDKWVKVVILGLAAATALLALPHREKILFSTTIFLIPLAIENNFYYETALFAREFNGIIISAFDLFFLILMLLWSWRLITDYTLRVNFFPQISVPFLLFWGFSFAGLCLTDISKHMIISTLWLLTKNWLILLYLVNNTSDKQEMFYIAIAMLLLTGLFQSLIGIGQYFNNGPLGLEFLGETSSLTEVKGDISRIGGTIGHPNKLALFLGSLLQLNLACFFVRIPDKSKQYFRWIYILTFAPMLITLIVSYSRSGWASFIAGGIINCIWCMSRRTGKKIVSVIVVLGFFASLAAGAFVFIPSVRNRLLQDDKGAAEVRTPLAQVAKNVIRDKPWLGIGLNNYGSCYPKYDDTSYWVGTNFPHIVHNEWLLIAAESGIPAFLCFLYILYWILINLWRISKTSTHPLIPYMAIGFFCGIITWGVHSLKEFEYVILTVRFWFNLGIMLSMIFFVNKYQAKKTISTSPPTNLLVGDHKKINI